MTAKEFFKRFKGINSPRHYAEPCPKFNPAKINTQEFSHELRPKNVDFVYGEGKNGEEDELLIKWESQSWTDTSSLVKEIRRCMVHIGFVGSVIMKIHMRSFGIYGEFGAVRSFVLRDKKDGSKNK